MACSSFPFLFGSLFLIFNRSPRSRKKKSSKVTRAPNVQRELEGTLLTRSQLETSRLLDAMESASGGQSRSVCNLAEQAIVPSLPDEESFPYVIRVE